MAVDNFNEICAVYKGMLGFSSEHLSRVIVVDIHSCMTLAKLWWEGTDPILQSQVSCLLISQLSIRLFFLYLKSQKGFRSCFTSFIYVGNTMYSTSLPRIAPYPLPQFCLSLKTQVKSYSLWKVFSPTLWLAASWNIWHTHCLAHSLSIQYMILRVGEPFAESVFFFFYHHPD